MNKEKLLDVCDFQGGTQPPKNEWVDHPRDGYVRMLQIRDYSQGADKFIQYVRDTKKLHKCKENDIMLSRYGYIGQAFTGLAGAYNVALVKVIKKRDIDSNYLLYYFQSDYFRHALESNVGSRATIPGFNKSELKNARIPLPRIEIQQAMSLRLSTIDGAIGIQKAMLKKHDELVKSRFIEMFGNGQYPSFTLGTHLKTTSGGTPSKKHPEYYENGTIPWLTSGEVNKGRISVPEHYITKAGLENSSAKLTPAGSVVVAMYGATAGQVGIVDFETATNQAVCCIAPTETCNSEYLRFALESQKDWMISQCLGGAQPNI